MTTVLSIPGRRRLSAPPLNGLLGLVGLLLLTLPFYRALTVPLGPVHLSIADGLTMLAGLYLGSAFCMGRELAWPGRGFSIALGLFLFGVCGSIVDAHTRSRSIHFMASIGLDLVLLVTVYQCVRTAHGLRIFTRCYVAAATLVAAIAILQTVALFTGGVLGSAAGTLAARNEMVFLLLPGFAMALASTFQRGPRRVVYGLAAFTILTAIVLSRGRAGTAFCLLLLAWVPVLVLRTRSFRLLEALLLWGCLLLAGVVFFTGTGIGGELLGRYTTSLQLELQDQRGSAWTRYEVLRGTWNAFESSPVFGIGAENFKLSSGQYVDSGVQAGVDDPGSIPPHSTYLGTLAETGLVGFVGLLGLVIAGLGSLRCIRHSGTEERNLVAGAAAAFTSLAAFLLVFDASARPVTWMFLGLALAVREVAPSPRFRPVVVTL